MDNFDALNKKTIQDIMNSWKSDIAPQDGEVLDPKESPRSRPAYILGNTSFRPFTEPLLKPKMLEGPEPYQVYEKTFEPCERTKDEHHVYDPVSGQMLKHQVITPQIESSQDLLKKEPPKEDQLQKLLPPGETAEEFLPAIRMAIKLTTLKKKALLRLRQLKAQGQDIYRKWKHRNKPEQPPANTGFSPKIDANDWHLYDDVIGEALSHKKGRPSISWNFAAGTTPPTPLSNAKEPAPTVSYDAKLLDELREAYKHLDSCLNDWERWGLLHYRPILAAKTWVDSETSHTTIEVVKNWSKFYDAFTPTRIESYSSAKIKPVSWLGDLIRGYSHVHVRIQQLPMVIVNKLPLLPDLTDSTHENEVDFGWELVKQLDKACDFLYEVLARYTRQEGLLKEIDQKEEIIIRERLQNIAKKGKLSYILNDKLTTPGPHFTLEQMFKIPSCVIATTLPTALNIDDWSFVNRIADAFIDYLKKAEKTFESFQE